jgi:hypothetical protein
MGYEPIDAEYEAQMEAIYDGVLAEYRNSNDYYEDIGRGIDEFISDRQKSFYLEKPAVAEPAFNLLTEARELFTLSHYAAAQVMAGAAAEVTFGDALLKPMVYGFVHSDTVAPMVAKIIEDARSVWKFEALLIEIVLRFSGIDITTFAPLGSNETLWQSVKSVRGKRNEVLHRGGLAAVTREEAEQAIVVAATLIETVFPAVLNSLGLHLHGVNACANPHCVT